MAFNSRIVIVFAICVGCAVAQSANGNTQCLNDLVEWCRNIKKSDNFVGNFMTSDYSSSGQRQTIYCMAGSGGTNCTLNNFPWFACRRDGSVTYKNYLLEENSAAPDDGICDASKKAKNLFSYDSAEVQAALNAGREQYERAMSNMRRTMDNVQTTLQRTVNRPCFPFCNYYPFRSGFPFNG